MNVEAIIDKVIQSMTTKTVIGEPMEVGSLTLIPILNVSFGFGAGGGEAKAAVDDGGSGTGAGGGARMKVAGVLVIKGDDVQFVQTGADGALDKLVDAIPDLLERVKARVETRPESEAAQA